MPIWLRTTRLPLTLTLSPGRGNSKRQHFNFSIDLRQIQSKVFEGNGEQFPLSLRERAGVRGKWTDIITKH